MYTTTQLAGRYLKYLYRASNGKGHGTHSPFVYEFITRVLNDPAAYPDYKIVESLRRQLKADQRRLTVEDFGAGSVYAVQQQRSVQSIARMAAKPRKYGQLLYRMVKYYQPRQLLELGTSLGITSTYLSLAAGNGRLTTLEGAPEIAAVARENFNALHLENTRLLEGSFESTLPGYLETAGTIDFAFIDGNHRKEPTLAYFNQLMRHAGNNSLFIFDDIHWSAEMEESWDIILKDPRVRCTIDLFFIGIVVFRQEFREKQQFEIRF